MKRLVKTKDGRVWSASGMGEDTPEAMSCCPPGGGFVRMIPKAEIVDFDHHPQPEWHKLWVGFDGEPRDMRAWVNAAGPRWNGWAVPYAEKAEAQAWLDKQSARAAADGAESYWLTGEFQGETLWLKDHDGETWKVEPEGIMVPGEAPGELRQVMVYDMQNGLTWDEDPTPERLAHAFVEVLGEQIGSVGLAKTRALNAAEVDPNVCHSHDFCDASMAMVEAFERIGEDAEADKEHELWNAAWKLADLRRVK